MELQTIYILKDIISQITKDIADFSPERGGLLMGPPNTDAITYFQIDSWARQTGVTYTPNAEILTKIAREIYSKFGWIIKGMIHSHPGNMTCLTPGDIDAIQDYFQINPQIPYFVAPIICHLHNNQHHQVNNVFPLKGNCCNAMVVHVIYRNKKHTFDSDKTVNLKVVNRIDNIPHSDYITSGNDTKNLSQAQSYQIDRFAQQNIELMKREAPNAEAKEVNGTIIWYEWIDQGGHKYQLAYWKEQDVYKAGLIEGSHYLGNEDITYLDREGNINLYSLFKGNPYSISDVRCKAIRWAYAYSEYRRTKTFELPSW